MPNNCQKVFVSTTFDTETIKMIENITVFPIKYRVKLDNYILGSTEQFSIHVASEEEKLSTLYKLCSVFIEMKHQPIVFCQVAIDY